MASPYLTRPLRSLDAARAQRRRQETAERAEPEPTAPAIALRDRAPKDVETSEET